MHTLARDRLLSRPYLVQISKAGGTAHWTVIEAELHRTDQWQVPVAAAEIARKLQS